jgi:hypothetical protein
MCEKIRESNIPKLKIKYIVTCFATEDAFQIGNWFI